MRIGDGLLNREIQIGDKFPTVFGIFKVVEIKGDTYLCSNEYTTNPISFSKNEIRKYVEFQWNDDLLRRLEAKLCLNGM